MNNYNPTLQILELIKDKEQIKKEDGTVYFKVEFPRKPQCCPHCKAYTEKIKDYRSQDIHIGQWMGVNSLYISLRKRRYACQKCGHTFYEEIPWIRHYQRRPQCVKQAMIQEAAEAVPFSLIARRHRVSTTTVIRYFNYVQMAKPVHLPAVLSIDEFRGNAQGHKFQVSLIDWNLGKVIDVLPNRDTQEIIDYFYTFPLAERKRVKYVVMDLSPLFRKAIRTAFPRAVIVGDRFHIQRLVTWAMEAVRKKIQKELGKKRIRLKHTRKTLCKPGWRVTDDELPDLEYALRQSEELRHAYALKEAFYKVWQMKNVADAAAMLHQWLDMVKSAKLTEFRNVLTTFRVWEKEIVQAVVQPYSNGVMEGKNTKIKTLKRVSYGIQNFRRLRNRILFMESFVNN